MTKSQNSPQSTSTGPTWGIWQFYDQAWKLTLKNKKLWILGLAVAVFSSGGSSNYSNSSSNSLDSETKEERQVTASPTPNMVTTSATVQLSPQPTLPPTLTDDGKLTPLNLPNPTQNPLVAEEKAVQTETPKEKAPPSLAEQKIWKGLQAVPIPVYALLAVQILGLFVYSFVVLLIAHGWSKSALILGVNDARHNKAIDLTKISLGAIRYIKSTLWVSFIPPLMAVGVAIVGMIISMLVAAFIPIVGFLAVLVAIFAGVYYLTKLGAAMIWAHREVVLQNLGGPQAFKSGWQLAKGNLWKVLKLSLANSLAVGAFSVMLWIPVIMLAAGGFISMANQETFSPLHFVPAVIAFIALIPVQIMFNAASQVFLYATWHYGYEYVSHVKQQKGNA